MKEDFFKVGYTTYLENENIKINKRTSSFFKKISKHKFILMTSSIIMLCVFMNFFLIYKFMRIIEISCNY